MRRALRVPCMTIAKNAGVDGAVVVAKVEAQSGDYGYDALNNEYGSLFEKGIIDPTKVIFLFVFCKMKNLFCVLGRTYCHNRCVWCCFPSYNSRSGHYGNS